jgi:pyrimidine operon attenuation protein/uracil phosphoribosyltransferase
MPDRTVVLDRDDMRRTLVRIAHEIVEKNPPGPMAGGGGPRIAIVGIHRRGAILAQRLQALTSELLEPPVPLGFLDISFYRDDLTLRPGAPIVHATQLEFPVDGRTIVIVDDVLYTGRTVRSAIDQIFDYGRPAKVQLAVLVDRGHRELPIRPDYVGKNIPTAQEQRVNVRVEEVDGYEEVAIVPAERPGDDRTPSGGPPLAATWPPKAPHKAA